jgi:hypothetical protein
LTFAIRLLKQVQQGGVRWPERGVLLVRRSPSTLLGAVSLSNGERPSAPTPQMGLFQQPATA